MKSKKKNKNKGILERPVKQKVDKTGMAPGTLIHVGDRAEHETKITCHSYGQGICKPGNMSPEQLLNFDFDPSLKHWINIDGLHDVDFIDKLGKKLNIDTLILEDVLNTEQRPKAEDYPLHFFMVMKMLRLKKTEDKERISSEQISLVLGENYVISFQEKEGDIFNPIRERTKKENTKIRNGSADYMFYAIVDAIVDNYYSVMESIGNRLEDLEDSIISQPTADKLQEIYRAKRHLVSIRRAVWPLREGISLLQRTDSPLIRPATQLFVRDVMDHLLYLIETIETYRDVTAGLLDTYLSVTSFKMNEIMKVLTIISTVFIPLTFFTGMYGMNFEYIPELSWHWGYPTLLLSMAALVVVQIYYFKRKGWL